MATEPAPPVKLTYETLSRQERKVLFGFAVGASSAVIAGRLDLSEHTVRAHAKSIYRKLHARNRPHAVAIGFGIGLLRPSDPAFQPRRHRVDGVRL